MYVLPDLNEVLKYRHPGVVASYVRNFPEDKHQAEVLFEEMLKFLWISRKHALDREKNPEDPALAFLFVMHEEMRNIDNMWHSFVLYTREYTDFCHRFFGEYMHHQPDISETFIQTVPEFGTDLEKYLDYVYDNLGESTVRRWFSMHLEAEVG